MRIVPRQLSAASSAFSYRQFVCLQIFCYIRRYRPSFLSDDISLIPVIAISIAIVQIADAEGCFHGLKIVFIIERAEILRSPAFYPVHSQPLPYIHQLFLLYVKRYRGKGKYQLLILGILLHPLTEGQHFTDVSLII